MTQDLCFSPDSKRLYDIRGQFCNIWEPNALIRVDETGEQDSEVGSEVASNPTAAISETFAEARDQITAVAIQFGGKYHAIGSASGVVSVVNSLQGDRPPTVLWRSLVELSIGHLAWSADGNYLACVELTGNAVVKEVQIQDDQPLLVRQIFGVKLQLESYGVKQVILNHDGSSLLVVNEKTATIWSNISGPEAEVLQNSVSLRGTRWAQHPTDPALLLVFSVSDIYVYCWNDFAERAVFVLRIPTVMPKSAPSLEDQETVLDQPSEVSFISKNPAGSHFLVDSVSNTTEGHQVHHTYLVEASTITPTSAILKTPTTLTGLITIPPEIQEQIEYPLGILPNKRLIFLDNDYWMCSWRLGANFATEKVQRYYFLPQDWLNLESLDLCALLADGRFLIPNNGDLAVIRSTGMSHW